MKPKKGEKTIIEKETETQFPIIESPEDPFLFFTESEEYFRGIEEEAGF